MAFDISNYMRDSLREIVMTLGKPSTRGFCCRGAHGLVPNSARPANDNPHLPSRRRRGHVDHRVSFNLLTVLAIVLSVGWW